MPKAADFTIFKRCDGCEEWDHLTELGYCVECDPIDEQPEPNSSPNHNKSG